MTLTAFVTGGSGFVGRNLIRALRTRGDTVRALVRSDASAATVSSLGAEAVPGDLEVAGVMREAMHAADVVFHVAAEVAEWGPRSRFEHGNVEGTRNVLTAAKEAGVPTLVHVSTEAVLADGSPLVRVDESRPRPAHAYPRYPDTKGRSEAL